MSVKLIENALEWLKLEALHWVSMRLPNLAIAGASLYAGHLLVFLLITLVSASATAYYAPIWAVPLVMLAVWLIFFAVLYRFQRQLVLRPMVRLFLTGVGEKLEDEDLPQSLEGLEHKKDQVRFQMMSAAVFYTAEQAFQAKSQSPDSGAA